MQVSILIHPDELSEKWIDRLCNAGIKTLGIHPCGGKDAAISLQKLLELMKTQNYRRLINYAHSRGLEVEYELHVAGHLMPRELFQQHPEYFRMDANGKRTNDYNFCVSNPAALELIAEHAAELAGALYGSDHNFYFWMDDGRDIHCHCPRCKQLSPSDQQLLVINRMLLEIKKYIPDARMAYLAYVDSIVSPVKVKAEKGVFLEYAPFEKYTAKGENASNLIQREKEMIKPLMCFFGDEQKKLLEYWYDNSMFSNWTKPPAKFVLNKAALKKDVAEYLQLGFDFISTFACFLGEDYEEQYGNVDITPLTEAIG